MAKFTNEQLAAMARPASVTEEQKLENAENAVKNALSNYTLASGEYEVFGQGSYANNTNIIIRKTKCLQVFKRKAFFRKTKSPLSISFELRLNIN